MYRLLIADDEYEIRNGLSNYFPWNEIGFTVSGVVENGMQVLDFIDHNEVDVILCDIMMPGISGIDVAKDLFCRNKKIQLIFLSGFKDFEYARQALIYGVRHYIVKPTKYNELLDIFTKVRLELDQNNESKQNYPQNISSGKGYNYNEKVILIIKEFIAKNFSNATLESVALLVNMNPFYLSKFFKEKTNQNFSEYLISVKMEKAAEFLRDINYKTYEVALMVGYSDAKNFTRAFRKYFSKSPREFRNDIN